MQQSYSSTTLPFKRGTITDAKGTVLASSSLVYNVILDAKQILEDEDYLEPTLSAVATCFGNDEEELRKYIEENPDSQYYIIDKMWQPRPSSSSTRSTRARKAAWTIYRASGLRKSMSAATRMILLPAMSSALWMAPETGLRT